MGLRPVPASHQPAIDAVTVAQQAVSDYGPRSPEAAAAIAAAERMADSFLGPGATNAVFEQAARDRKNR